MKVSIISICLGFVILCSAGVASAQCVKCSTVTNAPGSNPRRAYFCESTTSGAKLCSTSSNQQVCTVHGFCGGSGGGDPIPDPEPTPESKSATASKSAPTCTGTESIGDVSISQDVIDLVSSQSQVLGRALSIISENGSLGVEKVRVFTFENEKEVEVLVEVVFENKRPVAIKMTSSDSLSYLELPLAQEFSFRNSKRWSINNWTIK